MAGNRDRDGQGAGVVGVVGELLCGDDEACRAGQHAAAERRERDPPGRAFEEACAEVRFECRDASAGDGLGHPGAHRPGGEALALGHGDEGLARREEVEVAGHGCDSGMDAAVSCFACMRPASQDCDA